MNSFEQSDDFITDDLLTKKKNKKVDGKKKGNRVELELTKLLNARFGTGFTRNVGSGNRWGQTNHLSNQAKDLFSGDISVPKGFKFVIESKGGYDGIDLNSIFSGNSTLDEFIKQVTSDSERCGRKPLLCWKRTRKDWLAFVHTKEIEKYDFNISLKYGIWTGIYLSDLLKLEDSFFLD